MLIGKNTVGCIEANFKILSLNSPGQTSGKVFVNLTDNFRNENIELCRYGMDFVP